MSIVSFIKNDFSYFQFAFAFAFRFNVHFHANVSILNIGQEPKK